MFSFWLCGACSFPLWVVITIAGIRFAVSYGKKPDVSKTKKRLVWAAVIVLWLIITVGVIRDVVIFSIMQFIPRS